jgi:Na+/H+ antiporter NhaC
VEAVLDGFKTMIPAIVILVLAWSLATVTGHLHTASYLTGVFSYSLNPALLPAITFVFAGLISFSTGSSWSTMAILYPLVLPLTWSIGVANGMEADVIMPIFYNVTATVLAGSVLGDHCSPISDTTILSSLATNCNHVDHVRTQLPYALTVGAVSLLTTGFLSVIGVPFFINFPLGLILLYLVVRFAGTPVPEPAADQVDQKG